MPPCPSPQLSKRLSLAMTAMSVVQTARGDCGQMHGDRQMSETLIPGYRCLKCDHTWKPRKPEKPATCPKCNSPRWDRPRKGE